MLSLHEELTFFSFWWNVNEQFYCDILSDLELGKSVGTRMLWRWIEPVGDNTELYHGPTMHRIFALQKYKNKIIIKLKKKMNGRERMGMAACGSWRREGEVGPPLWIPKNHEAGFWSALQLQGRTWNPNSNFFNFSFNQKISNIKIKQAFSILVF